MIEYADQEDPGAEDTVLPTEALLKIANSIASLPWGWAILGAVLMCFALSLFGVLLIAVVFLNKVTRYVDRRIFSAQPAQPFAAEGG